MPKKTFLKLPPEKQQRILNAAADEFIEYKDQYEKSSVNRIADRAGISVGSIYKYFYDKDDLYDYSKKEIGLDLEASQVGNDLANIIFQNTSLFQGLVFSDTATPDYLEKLKDYLAKDQKRGILKDDVDLEVAAYLYSTIEFNAYQYCIAHDLDFSKDTEILRKMTDMFFFGIYRDDAEAKIKKE